MPSLSHNSMNIVYKLYVIIGDKYEHPEGTLLKISNDILYLHQIINSYIRTVSFLNGGFFPIKILDKSMSLQNNFTHYTTKNIEEFNGNGNLESGFIGGFIIQESLIYHIAGDFDFQYDKLDNSIKQYFTLQDN